MGKGEESEESDETEGSEDKRLFLAILCLLDSV
jgi:hypothetical protein